MDIGKQFVPFLPSSLLKDLGFNSPCIAYFTCENKIQLFLQYDSDIEETITSSNNNNIEVVAPIWQQAFDWCRENYGYVSYVREATKGTYRFYIERFDDKFFTSEKFDSYEEARFGSLIKLIETIKFIIKK